MQPSENDDGSQTSEPSEVDRAVAPTDEDCAASEAAAAGETPSTEPRDAADAKGTKQRKERVLHTRVSALLEQELKLLAGALRVPVSNMVRGILEEAVQTLDLVSGKAEGELRDAAEGLGRGRDKIRTGATGRTRDLARVIAGRHAADGVSDAPEPAAPIAPTPPLQGVIGFQPLLLARSECCAVCGVELSAGAKAFVGIHESSPRKVIIGEECLPASARAGLG